MPFFPKAGRLTDRRTAALILAFLLVGGAFGRPSVEAATRRAVWVWEEDTFRMLDDEAYERNIMAFLERQGISIVYLYADEFRSRNILVDEPDKYHRFITRAHERGFEVYALLGSYCLDTQEYILPEKREVAVRMFGDVLRFNSRSDDGARFDGVNIDIEPYLLDDWNQRQSLRIGQYLELSAEFMNMKKEADSAMGVGPAMPFWFDGIEDVEWNGTRRRLSEHVQDLYDYVAIMDYRNVAEGSDGIVSHAVDELEYADEAGRQVMIGVETLPTTPEKVTFFGKGRAVMEEQLGLAESAFSKHPSFTGFVIHHAGSYRALVAEP